MNRSVQSIKTIPSSLRIAQRWVLWRTEQRDGQATKVPKQPDGRNASTAAPHTWTDFETAYKALLRGDFDGVGFVLGGGIVGVDLDRCIDERGEVAPWAADIVHRLGSYSEISPSGRGLHILARAELPQELLDTLPKTGIKKAIDGGGAIEIYWTGRYFTVTGNVFDGVARSVETRTNELVEIIQELSERPQPAVVTDGVHSEPSDEELIRRIRASEQGEKFCRLFYDGNLSDYQGDESRADLALCSILAYWTGGDREQIDRLFRKSRLYRAKWDELRGRDTYGAITIEKACSETQAPKKPVITITGEGVEVRREADYGHAQVLAQNLKGRLRYATHRGAWMLHDGKRWTPKTDNVISKLAADILFHQYLTGA